MKRGHDGWKPRVNMMNVRRKSNKQTMQIGCEVAYIKKHVEEIGAWGEIRNGDLENK